MGGRGGQVVIGRHGLRACPGRIHGLRNAVDVLVGQDVMGHHDGHELAKLHGTAQVSDQP